MPKSKQVSAGGRPVAKLNVPPVSVRTLTVFGILLVSLLASCQTGAPSGDIRVRVVADGKELAYSVQDSNTVIQFLQQTNIQLGELDRVNPSEFTQITDGMVITIVRVEDKPICEDQPLAFKTTYLQNPDLAPGTTKVVQAGVNGTQRICYDVLYEDGTEKSRTAGVPTIITQPSPEIIYKSVDKTDIEPIPITGALVYIGGDGQARMMETNSLNDHPIAAATNPDGYVFSISDTGRQLLFTRKPDGTPTPETLNQLWTVLDMSDPNSRPIRLVPLDNVLSADWVPGQPYTFSFSTMQPRDQPPGYQALNDLSIARLDSRTGKVLKADVKVKSGPTGVYGQWGTHFQWSPDGKSLAWAQADGAGIVDFKTAKFQKLFDFKVYSTTLSRSWVWMPDISWSQDGSLLTTTVHGKPLQDEQDEFSPVFDVAVAQAAGLFEISLVPQAGMWAAPEYSPLASDGSGSIAYLRARTPIDSVSSEYDLVVADRDGSNATPIFPGSDKPGIKPIDIPFGNNLAWSPDGRQIALIYQGDVWVVDVSSQKATKVTLTQNVHHLRWVK